MADVVLAVANPAHLYARVHQSIWNLEWHTAVPNISSLPPSEPAWRRRLPVLHRPHAHTYPPHFARVYR
eukprot:6196359-Pleurochrysis_carterae.AAC.4